MSTTSISKNPTGVKMGETETHDIANCKDFLAQLGPIETLLGSVSYNEIDNSDGKTQQLRTSARVFKKMKFDLTQSAALEKEKKEEVKLEEIKPEIKKPVNPLWAPEEKNLFFEALNEFGKDFESIHSFICTRLKKKGMADDQLKTKHQIRHFYYKTFHQASVNLKLNEKLPKNVQELYTIINYGEMKRKLGWSLTKKSLSKLGELIAVGYAHFRLKGKSIRVKTPNCRALRRLNQIDEKYDDLKLPTRVLVELRPKDMVSFLKIQNMAQNPRIKVALSLQKRLSSLITCINTRWKSTEAIVYDKAVISTNQVTKDYVPDKKIIDENSLLLTPHLRLSPSSDAHVELPSIDINEYFTGQSISLTSFELKKGLKTKEEVKKEEPDLSKASLTKQNEETTPVNQALDEAVNTILSLQKDKIDLKPDPKEIPLEEKRKKIELIKEGWTVENCGCLTVGELYLMFGADSRLVLEYSWDPLKEESQEDVKTKDNGLTNSLKKLLSLAKLHSTKTVTKCSCGHVCGAKNNAQFKKPLTTKVVRKSHVSHETIPVIEDASVNPPVVQEDKSDEDEFDSSNSVVVQLFNHRDTMLRLNRNRGRCRYRQLVVERKLVPNKSESKHQIVSMNMVSQDNAPNEEPKNNDNSDDLLNSSGLPSMLLTDTNKLMEDTCMSDKNFGGLLDDGPSSMSTGISRILKENENQWISAEVGDYSLSSLLGNLDCPTKGNDDTQMSHLSQDVDSQLRTLLIETSIDYTAKFADLAAQVADNKK